jgi:hypothetical protein
MEREQIGNSEGIEQRISSWNRGLSKVFIEVTFVRRYFRAKLKQIAVSCNIILSGLISLTSY